MNSDSSPKLPVPPFERLLLAVAGLAVLLCLYLAITAPNPLFLAPFRESQTAISAYYLLHEPAGGMLNSQLPVLGLPWQLPLEFPAFQQMTAWVAASGIDVAQAGRLLSFAGFVACLLVGAALWRALALPARWRFLALALFAASPIYIYYATSHMIESCALLPVLLLLWSALRFLQGGGWAWLCLAVLAGAFSAMIKITTWLPANLVFSLFLLDWLWGKWKQGEIKRHLPRWLSLVGAIGIGFLAGAAWTLWAARVRSAHGAGAGGSDDWVFGGIHDRLSVGNWVLVLGKNLTLLFGPLGVLVPLVIILAWFKGGGVANRLNRCMAFGLAVFFIHVLVFIKLLLRHDYYVFGSGIFLLFATVCACMVLLETTTATWARFIPVALVLSMLAGGLLYGLVKRGYHDSVLEEAIPAVKNISDPGPLVTFGLDWSPQLPFDVHRKALMVVDDSEKSLRLALDRNHDVPFAAIVVVGNQYDRLAQIAARQLGFDTEHPVPFWSNGYLLVKPDAVAALTAKVQSRPHPILKELADRVAPKRNLANGLVYKRLALPGGPRDWLEVVVKRGDAAFFVRGGSLSLVRVDGYFTQP